ncbi:MAG TPA: YcnI family protein [Gaiellaceae bacterium]|nr:YcnI family protein [Gaiellaceae bacterium]
MLRRTLVPLLTASLILAPAAAAHVTINPNAVQADSFARFDLRVPNERENASTTKVAVKLPKGLVEVSFQPKPGWKRSVATGTVTWQGGRIAPGEFDEFGLSAKAPNEPGAGLTFPTVQTYSNGEVVHWIGAPDADEPAPQVTLEAAAPTTTSSGSDNGRANLALGVGIAGLAAGLLALGLTYFRRPSRP